MDVIKADQHRRLQLPGVPEPVARPVDIDQSRTGFVCLRSLRIYRFSAGSVIDGHAEDDEVLIVVLAGAVQLAMSQSDLEEGSAQFQLSAAGNLQGDPCTAYLPPQGTYRLIPQSDAEIAYARATTPTGRAPAVFFGKAQSKDAGDEVLLEESTYARRLRLRVSYVNAAHDRFAVMPVEPSESGFEALVHVKTEPARGAATISLKGVEPMALQSWDTAAVLPGERPTLHIAEASSALVLIVLAGA